MKDVAIVIPEMDVKETFERLEVEDTPVMRDIFTVAVTDVFTEHDKVVDLYEQALSDALTYYGPEEPLESVEASFSIVIDHSEVEAALDRAKVALSEKNKRHVMAIMREQFDEMVDRFDMIGTLVDSMAEGNMLDK